MRYKTSKELGQTINVAKSTVRRWCTNSDKIICSRSYKHSKFLQTLGTIEEIVGKIFKDIGFDFEPI